MKWCDLKRFKLFGSLNFEALWQPLDKHRKELGRCLLHKDIIHTHTCWFIFYC